MTINVNKTTTTMEKKAYIVPMMEEINVRTAGILAMSDKVGVFPNADPQDAGGALANPSRGWDPFGF